MIDKTTYEKKEQRLQLKQQQIDELTYELKLIRNDNFKFYKNNAEYYPVYFLPGAKKWRVALNSNFINGAKLDKRRNYQERTHFNIVKDWLETKVLFTDVDITEIHTYGWCTEAYIIYFHADDHDWELYVPVAKNVSLDSYERHGAHSFMLRLLVQKSPGVFYHICETFDESDLSVVYNDYLREA